MSTYTVSTYQYTDTDNVPGYALDTDHTSLTVTAAGSIVTGGAASDGIEIGAAHVAVLVSGTVQSKHADGIYVDSDHAAVTVNGTVEGYGYGIVLGTAADHTSLVIGVSGHVTADLDAGIDLGAAYASVTINGTVTGSDPGTNAVYSGGDYDTITVGATGHLNGGASLDTMGGVLSVSGSIVSADDGIDLRGHYETLNLSGHVSADRYGVYAAGYYENVHLNGTVESTGTDPHDAALYLSGIGSDVTIGSHGALTGGSYGISINYGGDLSVVNNGQVTADFAALEIADAGDVSFVNHGTMTGQVGVFYSAGISIVNSGTMTSSYGFYVDTAEVSISNSGTIHDDIYAPKPHFSPAYTPGIDVHNSGTWRATTFYASDQNFTLDNSGSIHFTSGYGGGYDQHMGIYLDGHGADLLVENEASGVINGQTGSALDLYGGTLDNAGVIKLPITVTGTIDNAASGSIYGNVAIYGGALNNYGSIHGGVEVQGLGETVYNYGTIAGRLVFDKAGTLYNHGNITGHVTGSAYNDTLNGTGGTAADWFNGGAGNDTLTGGSGGDSLYGGGNNDILVGGAGGDLLNGGSGHDVLSGGVGGDTLTGGAGSDQFVFTNHFGNDTITDFAPGAAPGRDFIHFLGSTFADFASVQSAMTVNGDGNVVITLDANDSITLVGVHNTTDLVAANFSFGFG